MYRLPRALRLRQQQLIAPRLTRSAPRRLVSDAWKPNGDRVRYQAVRFKKPGFTLKRFATVGLYATCAYAYGGILNRYLHIEVEMLDDEMVEEDEEEDDEFADEDSLFIPMTLATKLPRSFYKGSDPEWQEFVKVAKDKDRHKKIQNELVQVVYTGSLQHPGISRQLGKDIKVGKYWLDVTFPDGPPQEFERAGIEIGDGYIAWSHQRISPQDQWRLARALWPKAAFDSMWATTKMLAGINYRRCKQALGWEEADPLSPEERYRHAIEMMQKQQQAREGKQVGKAQMEPDGNSGAVVGGSAAASSQSSRNTSSDGKVPWQLRVPLPGASADSQTTDIPIAMHVFRATLSKQWDPKKMEPPRGSFVVQGLVEVRGSRGRVLFDVQSCYDPKEAKFLVVNAGVRNFKRWNQAPKGGP